MTIPSRTEDLPGERTWLIALAAVVLLATAMRFACIGRWSFASDELGTFIEVQQLLGNNPMAPDDPDRNVVWMVPLGVILHAGGDAVFGSDEAGCRTLPAIFGVAQILLVGLGLRDLVGRTTALVAALLLALSPEHLFYCQYHRFYAPAALFSSISLLASARAIRFWSPRWLAAAVIAALVGILVHALLGMLFGGMVAAIVLVRFADRVPRFRQLLAIAVVGSVVAAAYAVFYLLPLGREKAANHQWSGYSITQAVSSGINQVGWPVLLLAPPGLLLLWRRDRAQAVFWGVQAAVWGGSFVILPRVLPFHSAYVFAINLPIFVLAATAVGELTMSFASYGRSVAAAILAALLLMNLPSLASYYQDGSRHDFRVAANWVADRVAPNDLILAVQGDKLSYYRPELADRWQRPPNTDTQAWLDQRRPANGKVWIVLPGGRGGLPEPWKGWAERHGRWQATIVHRRLDYHEYPIFILLEDRPIR